MSATHAIDARNAARANLFLMAVLKLEGSSFPVRIWNLAPTAAVVDGKDLPDGEDAVRLQRGPHNVIATISWRNGDFCGLRFASAVAVDEWAAYGAGHLGQQCVDAMVTEVRTGAAC